MAPVPQERPLDDGREERRGAAREGERVVISGVSGTYPKALHIKALSDILYNKVRFAMAPVSLERPLDDGREERRGAAREGERVVISGVSGTYPKALHIKALSDILYNKVRFAMAPVSLERPLDDGREERRGAAREGERVVISGVSGTYPKALHIKALSDILYNKVRFAMAPVSLERPLDDGREERRGAAREGERVVISGVSGTYPKALHIKALSDILYNKVRFAMAPVSLERPLDDGREERRGAAREGERVVISGVSGTYPKALHIKALSDILYNKVRFAMAPVSLERPLDDGREEWRGAAWEGERMVISGVSGTYPKALHIKALSDILYNKVRFAMAPVSLERPLDDGREERRGAAREGERVVISGVSGTYPKALHIKALSDILYNKVRFAMAPVSLERPLDDGREEWRGAAWEGERVVISGVSGAYPKALHIKDLSDILYNKVNPITENEVRWDYHHPEVPNNVGVMPGLDDFDAQFFKVHYRLSVNMDPMSRKILEHTYQAIFDAGVNPEHLSGKKVGVYIGSCLSESEKALFYTAVSRRTGLGIVGCSKSMFANRVSYWLNAKGPSLSIDAGCCSSAVALEQGFQAIMRGDCEAAVVGGCNLCLHPQTSIQFGRNIQLSKDGKTKSYDQAAAGCVRSEAINVLFLQKAKDALRIYADVVHVKTKYNSLKSSGSFKREPEQVTQFLREFYDEVTVSPGDVEYVEGFGAADIEADKLELDAIDKVFCPGRTEPLHVGSVMSNLGYCEAASGIAGITKVLLGYHTGQLAGNLHCATPRDDVAALREGRISILTDHKPIARSFIAVNGLSITGSNSHVLLHGHYKPKDLTKYQCHIPRLVLITSRTDTAVQNVIDQLKSHPIDPEELALIQNIHSSKINGHLGRGFTILDIDSELKTVSLSEKAAYFDSSERPLWLVYSGMGSQWPGMGVQLMRLPIFAAAIERCRKVLEPKGVDIVHIITSPDKTIYDNILHSFVGIAAVQIGLTDVLHQLGLVPDKIIGHSVGELGCAYADGCMTAEEMILSAYSRGLVSIQTPFIRGSMAAVGIGFEEVSKICPPEIEVACHNAPNSSTISGPADKMSKFVAQLTAKGIFAKEVPCSNIAYHSRYIAEAGPPLLHCLKEVIKTPKLRSERWVSTSVSMDRWGEERAKYSSAEYHTNNLLSPVLFEETSRLIPADAVLVEVAPHGLLQAILRRALPSCVHVPLTRRAHPDNARFLLEAIGKLFMEGYYPNIRALYPKVKFPVSTGTPHLTHLVRWAHQEKWFLAEYANPERKATAICTFKISLHDTEYNYIKGNQIGGKTLFPFASALVAAWDTLAMTLGAPRRGCPVQFRDVQLFAQPTLHDSRVLPLCVSLHRGNGHFEINDDITKVASGYIVLKHRVEEYITQDEESTEGLRLKTEEVYQIFNEGGHMYRGDFRSISETNVSFTEARVAWTGNWAACLDALLQVHALRQRGGRAQPVFLRRIAINTDLHARVTELDTSLKVKVCAVQDTTRCGGITLKGIQFRNNVTSEEGSLVLKFEPKHQVGNLNKEINNNTLIEKVLLSSKVGVLESLHWADASLPQDEAGISVKVHFAGLNVSDVLKATGDIPFEDRHYASESRYGMDFSGTTEHGARVMGLVRGGAASSRLRAEPALLWPVPAHWSLEDAATVPLPYAHALYCLAIKSRLMPRSRVLVSGGAGATGQAVISLALHLDCRVFVVVRDVQKKQFLMKMFPKLYAEDIVCCRDYSFVDRVLTATKGNGCQFVISGKGDTKDAYLKCCAFFGYTFDIHQIKGNENFYFRMNSLTMARSYMRIDFSSIFQNIGIQKKLQSLMAEGITSGAVRPLTRVSYAPPAAARAFRLLAASQHRGRVLLRMSDAFPPSAAPRIVCSADRCQLLVSDNEGLAFHLAERLVRRGARALHLHIPNTSARFSLAQQSWRKFGVNVATSSERLQNHDSVNILLKRSLQLGPVEGVFLMITKPLTDQIWEVYKSMVANLDVETRRQCPDLKFFAVIGVNNSIGEQICVSRAADKLPGMMFSAAMDTKVDGATSIALSANYSDLINAVEKGLWTMQPVIVAEPISAFQGSLLQQIATIAGLEISKSTVKSQTLRDLGITLDKAASVSVFLRDQLNVSIDKEDVPLLTVERIREIEGILKESDYTPGQGLKAFFPHVYSDALVATIDTVMVPTLTISSDMRDDEFSSESCLYIVPGLQGLHQPYQRLCERLQLAAVVLQPGLDHPDEAIQETTARYAKTFLNKNVGINKFYLLGHELGVIHALGLAAILEDHGLTGTVFCLGGGPEEFLDELERQLQAECAGAADSEPALQRAVARHMCALMGVASPQLDAALRDASTWRQKVEASVRALRGRVAHSTQYARLLIEAAYARVTQARRHRQAPAAPRALRSRVVLLRSPAGAAHAPHPLQRHSQLPLAVHDLRAPLASAADDPRVAAVVNQYLDEQTKQYYANKNLCNTYLMNVESFIHNPDKEKAIHKTIRKEKSKIL